jgi:hypothetical protein
MSEFHAIIASAREADKQVLGLQAREDILRLKCKTVTLYSELQSIILRVETRITKVPELSKDD